MKTKLKRLLSVMLSIALCLSMFLIPAAATDPVAADHVVISQVYGGGGNNGAPYTNDFIELYNPTDQEVSIDGWSVQYASATGAFSNQTNLAGSIPAGGYYLIQGSGGANGESLPTADAIGNLSLSGSKGKVALVSSQSALGAVDTESVQSPPIVDFVAYGSAKPYEGTGAAPLLSNTTAAVRYVSETDYRGQDTNDNRADFKEEAPDPRNASYGADETQCAAPKASPSSCAVVSGTTVTFSTDTEGASIAYNTTAEDAAEENWITGTCVTVTESATYYVRAAKDGMISSEVSSFTYTVVSEAGAVSISEAKEAAANTEGITVAGVVTYIGGKNVYIQDLTGAICLSLTDSAARLKVGDRVIATGTRANYNNLLELTGMSEADVAVVSSDNEIPDRGTATVAELIAQPEEKTPGYNHMCEIIQIQGAVLTSTSKLTQSESEITIYPAVKLENYPGFAEGETVDVTVRMYDYNRTLEVAVLQMTKGPADYLEVFASPNNGTSLISGAQVTLTCNNADAALYYTTDGSVPTEESTCYTAPIEVSGNAGDTVTIKAIAVKDGFPNSDVAEFAYPIREADEALNIKEVLALNDGTSGVKVTGQIAYFATSYSNPVIQSVIDDKTYSLYVFGAAPDGARVGDMIELTGTYSVFWSLPEMCSITASRITGKKTPVEPETYTIQEIKDSGSNMISRFVKIKDVTLGKLETAGSTPVTDATGTINIYKATDYPTQVVAGDVVDLYAMVACHNNTIQLYTGTADANGFNIYDVVKDTKPPVITLPESFLPVKTGQDYTVSVTAEDNKGIQSVSISYTIGKTVKTAQAMTRNLESGKYEYTLPGNEIDGTSNLKFTVSAADVTNLTTTSSEVTVSVDNQPQITAVTPARNSATGENKAPVISVTLDNAGSSPTVTMTLKKDDVVLFENVPMTLDTEAASVSYFYTTSALDDGKYTVTVTVTREDHQSITDSWTFTVGAARYRAYFGQLHSHTAEYSDGAGTLQDGLNYFANIPVSDNVDFVTFTDHSNYFDTTSAANPAAALNDKSLMTEASRTEWDEYVSSINHFSNSHTGSLTALSGFEMTWSGGPGHINTYNSDGLVSRNNKDLNNKTADAGMKQYYETLIQNTDPLANLSQFNHPGTTFGTFSDFAYMTASYDTKMVAVEVGNGDGAIGSGGYFPSYAEYTKALDKGWHVAPTNNQDNHKGHWGNANTGRTVIMTDTFSQEGLLQGLKNMSVYATEDKNLNISYTLNGQMMGSIISEVPTDALKFVVNIDDPDSTDSISRAEIVTNSGRIAASKAFSSNCADWEFELPSVQGYYYVRVTQADKNIAVTAPVWIGQAPLMGINSAEANTKMPVTGEEIKITTNLFNNETDTATVKSVTYSSGDKVLTTNTLDAELASMGTLQDTYSFVPTEVGSMTITISAVFSLNGAEKEYTRCVTLNVRDSEKLVYVGIDASHYNEYVDGNYKDNMGNFADLAADYNVRVVELNTSEALIAATTNPKFKMLVITPPTRRCGSGFLIGYKSYSDAEIDAVAAFAAAGNMVILTGWGDYYESYQKYTDGTAHTLPPDQQMSAQQNKLLSAIGASLRISDDEVKDDTNNGGQAQRLYLTNYNMSNPFLAGVNSKEQVYSSYGGSTIYAIGSDGQPTQTIPSSVSAMVYAFDTSYSSDDDGDGTTGMKNVAVPKYDEKYMVAAAETISYENGNTATVIVAGSAFMSNFEIQASNLDNYSTPAYSNYTILQNVVQSINPVTITDIAVVQAADEGESFTIRGIATSNASGYNQDTAFFDCIYVQDHTAGINAFPVSENIQAGQTVEIKGKTSSYNGERQIAVETITIIDKVIGSLPDAITETTAQAAAGSHLGSLVTVTGTVTSMTTPNNVVESIYVKDSSGVICRVFIDGYITKSKTIADLAVGATLTATGLSSVDTEGARIRIRDRADITCKAASQGGSGTSSSPSTTVSGTTATTAVRPTVSNGVARASVTQSQMRTALSAAQQAATASGGTPHVEIKVKGASGANTVATTIPASSVRSLVSGGVGGLSISSALSTLNFSPDALASISKAASADVTITVEQADVSGLSAAALAAVGNRPVYDFSVMSGGNAISQFAGPVTVSLPYTPAAGENLNAIIVYYISDSGELETVTNGRYDAATGTVVFATTHFSTYAVGYKKVSFTDVDAKAWYADAVTFLSARGITVGTSAALFSPDEPLTRGQFITLLLRAYDIEADADKTNNFSDAGDTYYTGYLAAAKKLGISNGVGNNNFAPEQAVTRQEMVTLLYHAIKVTGLVPKSGSGNKISSFADAASVDTWALEAMTNLAEAGIISGSNGKLVPKNLATRAEMAQMLFNLLAK